jgi:ADP-ribose pyrophosphatase YjhB (NUDIX family)
MEIQSVPHWLKWAREIQALAQTGDFYAENDYQRQRYHRLSEIAAEIISTNTGLAPDTLYEDFRAQQGYATPRVDVRAAVFKDGRLLLVRERADGGWTMPGGWADVGDLPAQGAEREVWEEAGFTVKATRLIGVYDANRVEPLQLYHAYKLVFLCELLDGQATLSMETSEVAFFSREEIPPFLSAERIRLRQIQDAFQALDDPGCPAVFD